MASTNSDAPVSSLTALETGSKSTLSELKLKTILQDHPARKVAFLHATTASDGNTNGDDAGVKKDAVLILEKTAIDKKLIDAVLSDKSTVRVEVKNDIYHNCSVELPVELNRLKGTLIYPATAKHIEKYREQEVCMVRESADDYDKITKPYILEQESSLKWVYNLLAHEAEADRIIFEDPDPETGFILAPDLKWDGRTLETMYVTAIVHKRGVYCLRELGAQYLPLLKNILDKGKAAIASKYGIRPEHLRIFFHYQPSYYHLHLHFTLLKSDVPGINCGKAHLLSDVISTLEHFPDYYRAVNLEFYLPVGHELFKRFHSANAE